MTFKVPLKASCTFSLLSRAVLRRGICGMLMLLPRKRDTRRVKKNTHMHAHTRIIKKAQRQQQRKKHNKNGQNISSHILMGWGCQGDLACSHGRRWSLSAYIGGKGGRKGGRHTRWFHSGDPVSTACVKKRREGKEKTSTGPSKTRGGKGGTLSSPELASLFSRSLP